MAQPKSNHFKKLRLVFRNSISFRIAVILAVVGLSFGVINSIYTQTSLAFAKYTQARNAAIQEQQNPTYIAISSQDIYLRVDQTSVSNNNWEVSPTGVSHLSTSAVPGTSGNVVLYAHNTDDRFGKIRNLKKGDSISLVSKRGQIFDYTVTKTFTVWPNQVEVIKDTKEEELTLYTCDGWADTMRFVVKARPVSQ